MDARAALGICNMDEDLVIQDIIDVADGESFCHGLNVLDGGVGVHEREGLR